jgi:hypothetical protein
MLLSKYTRAQLQEHIRKASARSINVTITQHASVRMRERRITNRMLFDVLRSGVIRREPEPDIRHSGLNCQVERFSAGVNIAVLVNVEMPSEGLIVVTVYELT